MAEVALVCIFASAAAGQSPQQYSLRVNGSAVPTLRPATRLSGEWYVPIAPVAKALGADVKVDATGQALRVLRSDGVTASYDAATGRILQGSLIVGQVKNFRLVQLNVGIDNLLFPLDGLVALFGVTAQEDTEQAVLDIESLPPSTAGAAAGRSVHLASLSDTYSFFTNGPAWQQAFDLRGQALAGGNNLTANLELNRVVGGPLFDFRQGMVRLETASHRVITAGDQGTSGDLDALSNTVRGMGYQWRWHESVVSVYGGRAASTVSSSIGTAGLANYDTTLAGFRLHRKFRKSDLSLGGNGFRGERRSGGGLGLGYSGTFARNEFRLQGLVGYFSGFSLRPVLQTVTSQSAASGTADNPPPAVNPAGSVVEVNQETEAVKGVAYGLSAVNTFAPFESNWLLFTGVWERYSKNFLVVRDDSQFSAVDRKSVSTGFRPSRYFSVTGSIRKSTALLGNPDLDRGYAYGANAITPGTIPLQLGYFRSVQTLGVRFAMSQYSLQLPRLDRFSASAIYSEFRFGTIMTRSTTATLSADFVQVGRLTVHDQLQFGNSHDYGFDWSRQFKRTGVYFLGGLERQLAQQQRPILAPVASLRVPLPRRQHLAVSYFSVRGSKLLRFEIGGPLLQPRELVTAITQPALVIPVSIMGQVYYDIDLDERFKGGVDRPLPQLRVLLDGKDSTTTDAGGYFRFDGLTPGSHRLRVAIANLPADLVLVHEELSVAVIPYGANRQDFRAVRVGRIQGTVRLARMNEIGESVETPYPDARIVAAGNRESYSERDGDFVLADLPPGTYQLHVDPTTIPPGFVARPGLHTVQVKPGQSTDSIDFVLARPVIVKPPLRPSVPEPGKQ